MVIRRVSPLSCAKVGGILYAMMGLLLGAVVSIAFMAIGTGMGLNDQAEGSALMSMFFGAGAFIAMPIFYGLIGAVGGALTGLLYNMASSIVGGVEIEVQTTGTPGSFQV